MKSTDALVRAFVELHPDDAARILETEDAAESAKHVGKVPVKAIGRLLERLGPDVGSQILKQFGVEKRREVLLAMSPMQASAVLHQLDEAELASVLEGIPVGTARTLREIAQYSPEQAGGMMAPRVTSLAMDLTVEQAINRLRRAPRETLYYLYVTNREGELVGVINMRDLLLANARDRVETLVRRSVLSVPATMPRDEVIALMRERGFLAMPVVDINNRLIGVIQHEEAMQAGQAAAFEDMQKMVGAGRDERALSPVSTVVKRRLPWLYVNLGTAFLAAAVVGLFEGTIEKFTALAVLLPVVAGQGGNSGSQSLAVVMRGLALRELPPGSAKRLIAKEVLAGFINGLAVGAVTALAVYLWNPNIGLALVIGLAMPVTMVAAALAGAIIPLTLRALGRDPAQSAGIFLTTVTDVVGFASFLGFAVLFTNLMLAHQSG